jgi:hypothetical protein
MGSISFGDALVAGKKRVPRPATGKTAERIFSSKPSHSSVHASGAHDTNNVSRDAATPVDKTKKPGGRSAGLHSQVLVSAPALRRRIADQDIFSIELDDMLTNAANAHQRLGIRERAVVAPICNDGRRKRRPDSDKFGRKRFRVGSVDIYGSRQHQARDKTHDQRT